MEPVIEEIIKINTLKKKLFKMVATKTQIAACEK